MTKRARTAPARRRLSAEQRRELIVDSARAVFAESGYADASMQAIARRAGVVVSVLYDHVGSKRELYLELVTRDAEELIEQSTGIGVDDDPKRRFAENLAAFYAFIEDTPLVWQIFVRDPPSDPEVAALHARVRDAATRAIAASIATAAPDRSPVAGVAGSRAEHLLALGVEAVNAALAGWWSEHREVPREEVVAVAEALLWEGLGTLSRAGEAGRAGQAFQVRSTGTSRS